MAYQPLHVFTKTILSSDDMSSNLESSEININGIGGYSIQFIWSSDATPVGTINLAYSDNGTDFTDDQDSFLNVSGASGSHMINVIDPNYSYVKLIYTATSGGGGTDSVVVLMNGRL